MKQVKTFLLLGCLLLAPGLALACSGPGAAEKIQRATVAGTLAGLISAGLALATTVVARRRGLVRGPMAASWVLVAAHPGFWVSARIGDCGESRMLGGAMFTLLCMVLFAWAVVRPQHQRPPPR